jgi:hypothetical protein
MRQASSDVRGVKNMHKFILLALALILLSAEAVSACVCARTPSVIEARHNALAVFSGRVIADEYVEGALYPDGRPAGAELTVRFQVERWWKGSFAPEVVLFTGEYRADDLSSISESTCAYQFQVGRRYLVYADFFFGRLRAAYCSRTDNLEQAGEDLRILGRGRRPRSVRSRIHAR